MAVVGIETIKALSSPIGTNTALPKSSKVDDNGFSCIFKDIIKETNSLQIEANEIQEKFLLGEVKDLHTVMIAAEKASVAFNLVMEIRNKLLESYQELMRMPI